MRHLPAVKIIDDVYVYAVYIRVTWWLSSVWTHEEYVQPIVFIVVMHEWQRSRLQGPLLLTWFNFNPSMDK